MELHLSLALPTNYGNKSHYSNRKRCFDFDDEDAQTRAVPRTTLLLWNNQPDDYEDPPPPPPQHSLCFSNEEEDHGVVVGWPPVKSWRRKAINGGGSRRRGRGGNSKYVKVKMEGVGIARKVDLSLYSSYQTLMDTLTRMFLIYCGSNAMNGYKLVYQHSDGDWLLVEDVSSWRGFIQNVQRLKLARTIHSNGTGL